MVDVDQTEVFIVDVDQTEAFMVNVDQNEVFMVDVDQTELFYSSMSWSTVNARRRPLMSFLLTLSFVLIYRCKFLDEIWT